MKLIAYPINVDVAGKRCVVVGGGKVALRKIRGLLEAGALVTVIAPEICAGVEELFKRGEILWTRGNFSADMLTDELILIAATDNPKVNQHAAKSAQARKILANVVNATGSDFTVPSRIRRGDLLLTISTGANSPAFAKFLRLMIESEMDENFSAGLELVARKRQEVKRLLPNSQLRQNFWRGVLTSEVWQFLRAGKLNALEELIDNALKNFRAKPHDGTD